MQKAIIPSPAKALGQYVQQQQSEQRFALDGACCAFSRSNVLVAKRQLVSIIGDALRFRQHPSVQVARQVLNGLRPLTDRLAVREPLFRVVRDGEPACCRFFRKTARKVNGGNAKESRM